METSPMLEPSRLWPLVEARARATPDALCSVDERGERQSFAGLRERSLRVAAALAARGVGPDERVSWQLPTWTGSLVLVCALAGMSTFNQMGENTWLWRAVFAACGVVAAIIAARQTYRLMNERDFDLKGPANQGRRKRRR